MTTTQADRLTAALSDRYRIERELGTGGMATVYLARDLKHDRDIAIKVLHPDLGAALGAERFLSEIRTTARLQHPHILPLLDSGDAGDGLLYYVMPLVTGESLRDRLTREKQLPIEDAVRISREVADALGHAHAQGIIHRDIKPGNILLQGGHAVVADFGIALAVQQAGGSRMTQTGLSLGTPQYMSPEQAMGERSIDARSDLYALGAVTYEMLVGDPPFTGSTVQAIVARVLTERPTHPSAVRDTIPRHVERTVLKALAKLPADRQGNATEFVAGLSGALAAEPDEPETAPARRGARAPAGGRGLVAALAVVAITSSAAAVWSFTRAEPPAMTATFVMALPDSMQAVTVGTVTRLALSRDGGQLAYIGQDRDRSVVYIRTFDDTIPRRVRGTEGVGSGLVFSPDAASLLFNARGQVWRVPASGGTPVHIADSSIASDWGTNGDILLTTGSDIWRLAGDGVLSVLARADSGTAGALSGARFLPGNEAAICSIAKREGTFASEVGVVSIPEGKVTRLGIEGRAVRYAQGHLLVARGPTLVAIPFSLSSLRATGPAVQVADHVQQGPSGIHLTASDDGAMAWFGGAFGSATHLVAVNRRGQERVLFPQSRSFSWPRVSPDGRRIAVELATGAGYDIWVVTPSDASISRLTSNFTGVRSLGWSSDGRRVSYLATRGGVTQTLQRELAWIPWDLSGPVERLPIATTDGVEDASISETARLIAFRVRGYGTDGNLLVAPLDSPRVARPFVATEADEQTPRFSPHGVHLAYSSNETGEYEVYFRPVSGGGGRVQVSVGGGTEPAWARDGRGLFYRGPRHMMYAALSDRMEVTRRDTLFRDTYRKELRAMAYDVLPGNQELVMQRLETGRSPDPIVVLNWPELVRRRASRAR